jgi:hypothetical protein
MRPPALPRARPSYQLVLRVRENRMSPLEPPRPVAMSWWRLDSALAPEAVLTRRLIPWWLPTDG